MNVELLRSLIDRESKTRLARATNPSSLPIHVSDRPGSARAQPHVSQRFLGSFQAHLVIQSLGFHT